MTQQASAAQASLQPAAAGAAAALLQARPLPTAAAASLQGSLFPPPCCYLALAVCDGSALLLSSNLLAPAGGAAEPAGVHAPSRCFVGAAMLARRPTACSLPHSGRNGDCIRVTQHTDLAAAAQRWAAGTFVCLPFRVPPAADGAGASSSTGSSPGGAVAAALLLGVKAAEAAAAPQPAKPQQQHREQHREHVHSLLSLAAALVQHTAPELRQAAEALALLQPHLTAPVASQLRHLEPVQEQDAEDWEAEEEEAAAAAAAAAGGAGGAHAAAAQADASARRPRAVCAAEPAGAAAGAAEGGGGLQARAGAAPQQQAQQPADTSQQPGASAGPCWDDANEASGSRPRGSSRSGEPSGSRAGTSGSGGGGARGDGVGPSGSGGGLGGSGGATVSQPGRQAGAPSSPPPGAQQQQSGPRARQRQPRRRLPFLARLHEVLLLCWLSLRELLALPAARRSLGLDALLRFRGPAAPPAAAFHGEQWGLPGMGRGLSLEDEFAEYHSRTLADRVDAAASLLLLGVLILLCKEPASAMRMSDPLPLLVAALLALPVLALVPGTLRTWYVRHRERLLLLFFLVALSYQQANVNFATSHFARTSNARSINAGFQWITVDGLLLQMRFCHQLPTLVTCLLFNLGVIPQFCRRYHAHLEPRYCAAVAAWRALLCLLAPLFIIYLLELRVRRAWLLQRQERERLEEQQREQLRAEQLERRRRGRGDAAATAAWAGAPQ